MLFRRYRRFAGLSQEALAERARMSTNGIGALERGDRRAPQHDTLVLLAQALALSADERRTFEAAAARPPPARLRSAAASPGPPDAQSIRPKNCRSGPKRSSVGQPKSPRSSSSCNTERVVTITVAGGIGKTSTALQVGGQRQCRNAS